MIIKTKKHKLNAPQEFLQKILKRLIKFHDKNVTPLLDLDQISDSIFQKSLDEQKVILFKYLNLLMKIHLHSVIFLSNYGFGQQALAICRIMYEISINSEFIFYSNDKNICEKAFYWSEYDLLQNKKRMENIDPSFSKKVDWIFGTVNLKRKAEIIENLYPDDKKKAGSKIDHWSSLDLYSRIDKAFKKDKIKSKKDKKRSKKDKKISDLKETFKKGYRSVYWANSKIIHANDFNQKNSYPSKEGDIEESLVEGYSSFLFHTESLLTLMKQQKLLKRMKRFEDYLENYLEEYNEEFLKDYI